MKTLVDLIGPGAAKDLFFTARRIAAAEAKALGLITRACTAQDLPALLEEYTRALPDNAPITLAAGKAITAEILKSDPNEDRDSCTALISSCIDRSEEGRVGKVWVMKSTSGRATD